MCVVWCPLYVNQSWRASSGPGDYCQRAAGRKLHHHQCQPVAYSGVTCPQQNKPFLFRLVSFEEYWDVRCFKAAEHGSASTRFMPNSRMGMPRAVSWFPPVMKCSRRLQPRRRHTVISFTIRHSGVLPRLGGRWPLFCWHVESLPSASVSLFSGPMDGALCGWLELRAISVAGDSLSCCVFTARGPCPHSNQIADQETSSGTEKWGWGGIDEGCFCVWPCSCANRHNFGFIITSSSSCFAY